jgi:hypothetical protein
MHSFLILAELDCRDVNSDIKKSPFFWGKDKAGASRYAQGSKFIFSHPDFTVGQGISPCRRAMHVHGLADFSAHHRYGISPIPKNKF